MIIDSANARPDQGGCSKTIGAWRLCRKHRRDQRDCGTVIPFCGRLASANLRLTCALLFVVLVGGCGEGLSDGSIEPVSNSVPQHFILSSLVCNLVCALCRCWLLQNQVYSARVVRRWLRKKRRVRGKLVTVNVAGAGPAGSLPWN